MQNVGKRLSHKEKKPVFCWDTPHIFLVGSFVRRGAEENKTLLDPQIVWQKKNHQKIFCTPCYNGFASKFLQKM